MNLALISFTACAGRLSRSIIRELSDLGYHCRGWTLERLLQENQENELLHPLDCPLREWAEKQFYTNDGLIFIGAAGIAVRAIAPLIKSKDEDPAVVVIDEQGRFAIPLLSGHIGGANRLAEQLSAITGAAAVITTATDINELFAVDVFAKNHGLSISDMKLAKAVSADLLDGTKVGFYSDFELDGRLPDGFAWKEACKRNLWITVKSEPINHELTGSDEILRLIPRKVVLGIGCKKGISEAAIADLTSKILKNYHIDQRAVGLVSSIDLKKDENGLCGFVKSRGLEMQTFSARTLCEVAGEFTRSEFVRQTTGVDNVCERAALAACPGGRLIIKKQAAGGVTVAAAIKEWKVQI